MGKLYLDAMRVLARRDVPPRLRSKLDPEDLVQAAYVKATKADARFVGRTDEEVRAYLRRALVSALAEVIRGFDRGKRRLSGERSLDAEGDVRGPVADHTSPTARARKNEQMVALTEALASLPEAQRRAIDLHYFQRLSLGETAETMGVTYASAAGLVRRGLRQLRERLVEPMT